MLFIATTTHADDDDDTPVGVYPEALVKLGGGAVVNGCGPEALQFTDTDHRFANKHTYKFEIDRGFYKSYTVNFVASCNLHDAGYEGRFKAAVGGRWVNQPLVYDRILKQYVDYSTKSRAWIDQRFLDDMRAECDQQIGRQDPPEGRARAITMCKGDPFGVWGAETLYKLVRQYAAGAFSYQDAQRVNDRPGSRAPRNAPATPTPVANDDDDDE